MGKIEVRILKNPIECSAGCVLYLFETLLKSRNIEALDEI